ncbi:hypothetical protein [Castellaniella sp.]|uniref:hypothetical protein n=1 Tax=Castellaniella sp. TaxID=1955812 RepID=UPI003A921B44
MAGCIDLFDAAQALTGSGDDETFDFWLGLLARQVEDGALHGVGPRGGGSRLLSWATWCEARRVVMDWQIPVVAFEAWCKKYGYAVSAPTSPPPPPEKESPRRRQIAAILSAINDSGYDPLCIPRGGKKKIEDVCLGNAQLFTSGNSFERAWQAAGKQGQVRVKDHKVYARGM